MNFDTISTKPEKSLSGKLSEILGTISKKVKPDEQEDENVPQLDGMIDIQEEKPQNKKESVGNSRQKDSGRRKSAKIEEKESSKSKEILHEKSKETLQETLKRLKEERESSKNDNNNQEKKQEHFGFVVVNLNHGKSYILKLSGTRVPKDGCRRNS